VNAAVLHKIISTSDSRYVTQQSLLNKHDEKLLLANVMMITVKISMQMATTAVV
jgi:hypothetical protein